MEKAKSYCDLLTFKLAAPLPSELSSIPTVCLLVSDTLCPQLELENVVDLLVASGCNFFMSWGDAADLLHDSLDNVVEDRANHFLNVVTTSHKGETTEEVAWFLVNSALLGEANIRCFVLYSEATLGADVLLSEVRLAVAKRNATH
jgi:hypothetical protein